MQINGATALVTGANRGLGRHLAQRLRDRGARVYAAARKPESVDLDGVTPIALDVTDPASVASAAEAAADVSILVNNAGISTEATVLGGNVDDIRREFETNVFGTLSVSRAFAPVLGRHAESYLLNVLSVVSWFSAPHIGGYSASKSAEWSITNALRQELAGQGTRVGGLHVGYMDTGMTADFDVDKLDPADIARITVDGIASGQSEIIADQLSQDVRSALARGVAGLYPEVA